MRLRNPRTAASALAFLIALTIAAELLWMPIQVGDSLGEILDASASPSIAASFKTSLNNEAYLRPLRIAQIKALFDAAGGEHYWLVYRGFHALLIGLTVWLFVRALRVSTAVDLGAAVLSLAVLTGLHTFRGTVQEAFPINHFLEMALACLVTLQLSRAHPGLRNDVAGAVTLAVAALTLESGLLVWVVAVAAWAVGWRGISTRGVAMMTAVLAGYLGLRFLYLSTGMPELTERSSGYGLAILEPRDLQERFGSTPSVFYAYNIAASALSVLFGEPRSGVFVAARAWLGDAMPPRTVLPVVMSTLTTLVIALAAFRRLWKREALDDTGRFIVVMVAVLIANAVLSFAYTKDEIMGVAGVFYALAAYGAIRDLMLGSVSGSRVRFAAGSLLVMALATGWAIQMAGVHYLLRSQAIKHQNDWVILPYAWKRTNAWPDDPARQQLILRLRRDAIALDLPNARLDGPRWVGQWWTD